MDFVSAKRAQWNKLHEAATNPPPSSSLVISDTPTEAEKEKAVPLQEEVAKASESKDEDNGTCSTV